MDRPFIREMCDAFYNDKSLHSLAIWDTKKSAVNELNNELIATVDQLYLEDNELYYELRSYDRFMQSRIVYNLLEHYLNDRYQLFEEIINPNIPNIEDVELNEVAISANFMILGGIAGLIGLAATWKPLSRAMYRVVNVFGKTVDAIYKFLNNVTRTTRIKHTILISHLQVCYKKCGITSPKDLSPLTGAALGGQVFTTTSYEQADCLSKCYINFCIEQIGLLVQAYLECLKSTGEDISAINSISILLRHPLGDECDMYYKHLEEFNRDFREVLDTLYSRDPRGKQDIINRYHKEINNALQKRR